MKNFAREDELSKIVTEWKDGSDEPLDGDEVDDLTNIIRNKINLMEGNITQEEYEEANKVSNPLPVNKE